jgi:hypothetical protein
MTRDGTHDTPPEDRDLHVGSALHDLYFPDYPSDFLASVWARLDADSGHATAATEMPAAGRAGAADTGPSRSIWARRPLLAGIAAVAVAAAVAATFLFGLPGASDNTGPPPVSAAAIVRIAQRALASGHTLTADCTSTWKMLGVSAPDSPPMVGDTIVRRFSLMLRDDGSYRVTDVPRTLREAIRLSNTTHMGTWELTSDSAYDAMSGVHRYYNSGYDAWAPPGKRVSLDAGELMGCAPGPPDLWTDWPTGGTYDFGGFLRALQTVAGGDVRVATYEGRRVWVVAASLPVLWGPSQSDGPSVVEQKSPSIDRLAVTVDEQTGLPLRTQGWFRGVLFSESRLEDVRVGITLPKGAFTLSFPSGAGVYRRDMGFRQVSLGGVAARVGYTLLVSTDVPPGYKLSQVAAAPRDGSWKWGEAPRGANVVSLRYQRGFDALIVTTRRAERPQRYSHDDAFGYDVGGAASHGFNATGSGRGPAVVRLTSGAFAGVRAWVVTGPLVMPHLWAMKHGVLLTIAGGATADELVTMAESMDDYRHAKEVSP